MSEKTFPIREISKLRRFAKYGDLLSGLIHNMNTPLVGISGRLELIKFKMPDLKGLDQMTEQIERINQMLSAFSAILEGDRSYDFENMSLEVIIKNVDALMHADLKYKHKINVNIDLQGEIYVSVMTGYLYNALYEILRNCLDSLDESGKIGIKAYKTEENIVIEISNDGEPFPERVLEAFGKELISTKQEHFGFGLYSIKSYIDKLNGKVSISNLEQGVLYQIFLPKE